MEKSLNPLAKQQEEVDEVDLNKKGVLKHRQRLHLKRLNILTDGMFIKAGLCTSLFFFFSDLHMHMGTEFKFKSSAQLFIMKQ